jgi:hypothetical protein
VGWIFNEELTPISIEELPPNEFFFDKKRKAMVRQELYQKEGVMAKKFKIMIDGKAVKEEEFANPDSRDTRGICYSQSVLSWDFEGPVEMKEPLDQ